MIFKGYSLIIDIEVINVNHILPPWAYGGFDLVEEQVQKDPDFQALAAEHEALAPKFEALLASLPQQQRELILEYLNLAVDLEYQRVRIAYRIK